ncbi:hypothetical protein GQ472_02615, partial [archaeon]|nr:hypothetical protein [archaeon]
MNNTATSHFKIAVVLVLFLIIFSSIIFASANNTDNISSNTTITKIIDFIFSAFNISARLVTENSTPIGNQQLFFYENDTPLSSAFTDIEGLASINYSPFPGTYNILVLFNGTENLTPSNLLQEITIPNITLSNETLANETITNETIVNETVINKTQINQTAINQTNATDIPLAITETVLQGDAIIGQPVEWINEITVKNPNNKSRNLNITIDLPESASEIDIEDPDKKGPAMMSQAVSNKHNLKDTLQNNQEKKYKITYTTSAPEKHETPTSTGKRILISSDESVHYHNISAHTDIPNIDYIPRLYRILDNKRIDVTDNPTYSVSYLDTDKDGRYDRIEWIVPQLSNDTYEIDLTILNIQSYPTVGGNWTVRFETAGTSDLTITAINGTYFGTDLEFLEIKCGTQILDYLIVDNSIFIENYTCNETGHEVSKVLTSGKHHLKFRFGNITKYAHNDASSPFNSTWNTSKAGVSNATTIKLPLESSGTYNFTVNWGDGNSSTVTL